jgi:hypothetical protein
MIKIHEAKMGQCSHCQNRKEKEVARLSMQLGVETIHDTLCLRHLNNLIKNYIHHPLGQAAQRANHELATTTPTVVRGR